LVGFSQLQNPLDSKYSDDLTVGRSTGGTVQNPSDNKYSDDLTMGRSTGGTVGICFKESNFAILKD